MIIDDNFKWFTGVVEDRNDPEKLNRVRVRVFGAHTDKKTDLATADLPWATVMMPTTSSSNSGIGLTVHGLVEGSWVVGFWKDGKSQQDPMIMGSFVGVANENIKQKSVKGWDQYNSTDKFFPGTIATEAVLYKAEDIGWWELTKGIKVGDVKTEATAEGLPRANIGFIDPRIDNLTGYAKTPEGLNPDHNPSRGYGLTLDLYNSPRQGGTGWNGINYPKDSYKNESDVNKLARGETSSKEPYSGTYNTDIWPNNMIHEEGIGKTLFSASGLRGVNSEYRSEWVKPKYPFNHVYESESGHVIEIDDTPGYERINLFHRKGARIEINNEGEIHMVAAPGEDINLQAGNVNIQNTGSGSLNINADSEVNITAKKAAKIISKGPTSIISSGITKLFSMLDTKIASIGKNIIG